MIAQIGSQVVLVAELMWQVNQKIAAAKDQGQLTPEMADQVREQAMQNMRSQLAGMLDLKLIINDLHAKVPAEALAGAEKELAEPFEDQAVPKLMEDFGVASRGDLDAKLRQYGSSLAQLRQEFLESRLAKMWLDQQTGSIPTITRDDLLREYEARIDDFAYPATARWQELMVRFDRFGGDRQAAHRALGEMGNQVLANEAGRGGAPFESVARDRSHGFTASNGGIHDWTAQGSLVAETVDAALFSLPIDGRPSTIITSKDGYHIVRVLERKPAGRTPFEEAQAEIREELLAKRRADKQRAYLEKLRKDVRIWTVYSGPTTAEEYLERFVSTTK